MRMLAEPSPAPQEVRQEPDVELRGISKRYGTHQALVDLDLTIGAGEVVAIIGPSGSGKSTLLRCINLLVRPDAGEVIIAGAAIRRSSSAREVLAARRKTAMVFQQHNLFRNKSVLGNLLEGPLTVQKRPIREAREHAQALLARMNLLHRAGAYPNELSGGEQQRVGIARALALRPKIILFDEPTASLDPQMSQEVIAAMKEVASSGVTMVVVTHELDLARQIADRIAYMEGGQIIEVGSPHRVFEEPREARTRRFVAAREDKTGSRRAEFDGVCGPSDATFLSV